MTTGNTLDIVRAVEENRLDLGLVTLPVQGRSLAVTAVVDEEFVVIHPSHEAGIPAVCTPEALQALPLIAFEAGSGTRDLIDRWFRSAGGGYAGDAAGKHRGDQTHGAGRAGLQYCAPHGGGAGGGSLWLNGTFSGPVAVPSTGGCHASG